MEEKSMTDLEYIKAETDYLFKYNFNDTSISPEVEDAHLQRAEDLLDNYEWNDIFACWFSYLKKKCQTPEEVINWANLFYWFGGESKPIANPYKFLGYLYYKVDSIKYAEACQTVFDGIVIGILEKIGDISLSSNPSYAPEQDTRITQAKEKWENGTYR